MEGSLASTHPPYLSPVPEGGWGQWAWSMQGEGWGRQAFMLQMPQGKWFQDCTGSWGRLVREPTVLPAAWVGTWVLSELVCVCV